MLKKILYNKFKIENIPDNLPLSSEEFLKILFELHNVIMFEFGKELRLLGYSGYNQDWLGRATEFQPIALAGSESYKIQTSKTCVKYNENPLSMGGNFGAVFSSTSYVSEDINRYIYTLNALDDALIINSKQVHFPFIAKVVGNDANKSQALKNFFAKLFGKEYKNLIVDCKITEEDNGTTIETTNMQVFLQQIQDTKKKVLDEAFFYLGISSAQGKLAHQSELEIESYNAGVDLLDYIMFAKIEDFINQCNAKFNLKMKLIRRK